MRRGEDLQRLDRLLSPVFLYEAKDCVQNHDDEDDDGVDPFSQETGDYRCDDEDDHQHVGELMEEED